MREVPYNPFFFISTNTSSTQKPDSNTKIFHVPQRFLVGYNIKDTVLNLSEYFVEGGGSSGVSLPSTNPTQNKIPESDQTKVFQSLLN